MGRSRINRLLHYLFQQGCRGNDRRDRRLGCETLEMRAMLSTVPPVDPNAVPTLDNLAVTSPIDENDSVTLTGMIIDSDSLDTHTLDIDWGDGTTDSVAISPLVQTTFSDGVFEDTAWDTSIALFGSGGDWSASQQATGGNPDTYRQIDLVLDPAPVGGSNGLAVHSILNGSTYDPAVEGAISSLDWTIDIQRFAGGDRRLGPALRQNGIIYIRGFSRQPSFWETNSLPGLTQSSFVQQGGGGQPDFSAAGAPIEFGFFFSGTVFDGQGDAYSYGFDNFDVVVNSGTGRSFSLSHQYLDDDPSGTSSDDYAVGVTVTDENGASTTGTEVPSGSAVLDQTFSFVPNLYSGLAFPNELAQTLTVGLDGLLSSVEVLVGNHSATTANLVVDIVATVGGLPSDNAADVLASVVIPNSALPAIGAPAQYVPVDLSSFAIPAVSGSVLAISLTLDEPNQFAQWGGRSSDIYAGGEVAYRADGNDAWSTQSDWDLGFKSYVTQSQVLHPVVTVNNVAPTFDSGPDVVLPPGAGSFFSRTGLSFTDPGSLDVWDGTVNYGDGTGDQPLVIDQSLQVFDLAHSYATSGQFTVTVTLNDDDLGSSVDSFLVDVVLNESPTASPQTFLGTEDTDVTITLSGADPDGDPLSALVTALPAVGRLFQTPDGVSRGTQITSPGTTVTDSQGRVIFAPDSDGNGTPYAAFDFKVNDGQADSAEATATINLTAVNDAPSFLLPGNLAAVDEDAGLQIVSGFASNILPGPTTAIDESGQLLTFDVTVTGTTGNLAFVSGPSIDPISGELRYETALGTHGTANVSVTLSDDGGTADGGVDRSAAQTFVITVNNLVDLSGRVFDDLNNDGLFNGADLGVAGVTVKLIDQQTGVLADSLITDSSGSFTFQNIAPGAYQLVEVQPAHLLDGDETAGGLGGTVDNAQDSNQIADIIVAAGDPDVEGYLFADIRPSDLLGLVWQDFNNDGEVNFGEQAIESVPIALTGTDDRGETVNHTTQSDVDGIYMLIDLRPGYYTLTQTQPAGFDDGLDIVGTVNGLSIGDGSVNDIISSIVLSQPGSVAENYNFGRTSPDRRQANDRADGNHWLLAE